MGRSKNGQTKDDRRSAESFGRLISLCRWTSKRNEILASNAVNQFAQKKENIRCESSLWMTAR
jgi:hypothetical protein